MHQARRFLWLGIAVLAIASFSQRTKAEDNPEFTAKFNDPIKLPARASVGIKLNMNVPPEGYYSCRSVALGKLQEASENLEGSGYRGFDLFANGTYRLRTLGKVFESKSYHWRHNPVSGRVAFLDGPLADRFKWPTHLDKWILTHWVDILQIDPLIIRSGDRFWVACRNEDPLQSTRQ